MSNPTTELQKATMLMESGDLAGADTAGRQILTVDPRNVQALRLLAKVAMHRNRPAEAEQHSRQAVDIDPDCVQCWNEYGTMLAVQGKHYEAISAFFRAVDLDPAYSFAYINLGKCYKQIGDYGSAIQHFDKALELDPNDLESRWNVAKLRYLSGDYEQAVEGYLEVLRQRPNLATVYHDLGAAYIRLGRFRDAVDSHKEAVRLNPENPEALNDLGNALGLSGLPEQGLQYSMRAIELKPDFAEAYNYLGGLYRALGDTDRAMECFRRALELKPADANCYMQLTAVTRYTGIDNDIRTMQGLSESPETAPTDKMRLEFALGKAYEDMRDFDRAFDHFAEANRILRGTYEYTVDNFREYTERVMDVFDDTLIERLSGAGPRDATPVFVLGMPRSGTTLVEQILSAHPVVFGAGEQYFVDQISQELKITKTDGQVIEFPDILRSLDPEDLVGPGRSYLDNLRSLSADAAHIVDKMPHNFMLIGLIRFMLPDARIVHCMRDPVDTCLSCFKSFFLGSHKYAQDLAELGRYYRLYERLMAFWRKAFPGDIYDVRYESLVNNPREEIAALLEFCGLDWNDACLEFHKVRRPVLTRSQEQVRRPMYKDAIRSWERYAHRLQPLLDALEQRQDER